MKKATIKLFDVHSSFKVKFSTFISTTPLFNKGINEEKEAIQKYSINGNTYYTIDPASYVTIDISTKEDKGENYSSNTTFMMNRRKLFSFILKLEKMYRAFTSESNLFVYNRNGDLEVNHEIANKYEQVLEVNGGKTLKIRHCVATYENDNRTYEAIYIAVNTLAYYSFLTYDQIEFLAYELRKLDFSSLEMNLITIALEYDKVTSKEIVNKPVTQPQEVEIIDTKKKVFIENTPVIPNL